MMMDTDDEIKIPVANGCTLRSSSEKFMAGDYVRLCDPKGHELCYWDNVEWNEDPIIVMGAIIMAANDLPKMYGEK